MKRTLLFALSLVSISIINAQVKIGNNPGVPVKSASLLELESTNKGLVFPRVSLTALNSPAPLATDLLTGTMVYNTNDVLPGGRGVYVWQGTAWTTLVTSTQRGGLQLQDSTTGNPTLTGNYNTAGIALNVAVRGNYAYVADLFGGLQIINISNPTNPTLAGSFNTPGNAYDVAVSGNYAYVADFTAGLQIINISNPASPTLAGSYNTSGNAWGVAVNGNYAYVADEASGLQIINVSNPASPTLAGNYNTPGNAYEVASSGNYAYVADGAAGLQIINVSNPASPTLAGNYNTPGVAGEVVLSGNYTYVTDDVAGLEIINISNPASPTLTGNYKTVGGNGTTVSVTVSGNYAYVGAFLAGLEIIDISNPASPKLVGSYDLPGYARGVALSGSYVLVANEDAGVQIINTKTLVNTLTVTANVAQIGALRTPSGNGIVTADGNGVLRKTVATDGLLVADANGDISTTNDFVNTTGAQTIDGDKTFTSAITAPSFSGNGSGLTNVVNTTAAQTIGGVKTFSSAITAPSFSGSGAGLTNVVKTTGDETIDGAKTFTGTVKATAYTSPQSGSANMVAVAYGNIIINIPNGTTPLFSSGNYTVGHTNGTGVYTITFSSSSSLYNNGSIGNFPIVATLGGVLGPGFITYNGGLGVLTINTYNSSGVATDRSFSFAIYKP